ncbi:methylenetetrahydrofolate reductase [Lysinibacter sp. HNR]|uniref:methylenetetrahydrofolate reductase n=1 Tax=Lysinibacter sp. HNR TaxID=3031408 RepID=UPI0024349FFB|nr:methylenetetrahydrofolate reductase [Lysinibacter sp. HNR]WGD37264.1 methylenetetrahydrofolate reductase [Lysinibacter sp. HNR]
MRVEVIPTGNIVARVVNVLPRDTTLTVTCLPQHGVARTIRASLALAEAGFFVIPHLVARQISGVTELRRHLDDLRDSGIRSLFVVGGDGSEQAGPYAAGGALLHEIRQLSGTDFSLGVAAYPEGHPHFDVEEGISLLRRKQELANFAVTQMCFSPQTIARFLGDVREAGIVMPLWLGIPSDVRVHRLLAIGARLGVGTSLRFARRGFARQLLTGGKFDHRAFSRGVDALVREGDPMCEPVGERRAPDAVAGFAGVHLYSFNDFESIGPHQE